MLYCEFFCEKKDTPAPRFVSLLQELIERYGFLFTDPRTGTCYVRVTTAKDMPSTITNGVLEDVFSLLTVETYEASIGLCYLMSAHKVPVKYLSLSWTHNPVSLWTSESTFSKDTYSIYMSTDDISFFESFDPFDPEMPWLDASPIKVGKEGIDFYQLMIEVAKLLINRFKPFYGKGSISEGEQSTGPKDILKRVPKYLYRVNYFGHECVQHLGRRKIKAVPSLAKKYPTEIKFPWRTYEFPDDTILLYEEVSPLLETSRSPRKRVAEFLGLRPSE